MPRSCAAAVDSRPCPSAQTVDGIRLGALCILHNEPRAIHPTECMLLANFAEVVTRELERDYLLDLQKKQAVEAFHDNQRCVGAGRGSGLGWGRRRRACAPSRGRRGEGDGSAAVDCRVARDAGCSAPSRASRSCC